jgi:hypothetical protein
MAYTNATRIKRSTRIRRGRKITLSSEIGRASKHPILVKKREEECFNRQPTLGRDCIRLSSEKTQFPSHPQQRESERTATIPPLPPPPPPPSSLPECGVLCRILFHVVRRTKRSWHSMIAIRLRSTCRYYHRHPPPSTEVKNAWSYISTSPYFFMTRCSVTHRNNCDLQYSPCGYFMLTSRPSRLQLHNLHLHNWGRAMLLDRIR